MNKWISGSGDGVSLSMGTLFGKIEGAPLPGTLKDKLYRSQDIYRIFR